MDNRGRNRFEAEEDSSMAGDLLLRRSMDALTVQNDPKRARAQQIAAILSKRGQK